jgi:hypothetical protein
MTDLDRALAELVRLFERLRTPYVVMGGLAVRVYGIPRATYDIDFTVAIERERLPELYRELRDLGYSVPEQYQSGWVDCVAGMPVVKARLYLQGRGIDGDLFLAESRFQRQLLARCRREQIDDFAAWLVSPEDLILLKLLAHRPRDLADVGDILFTQGKLDEQYLRHWAQELGAAADLERVLADR